MKQKYLPEYLEETNELLKRMALILEAVYGKDWKKDREDDEQDEPEASIDNVQEEAQKPIIEQEPQIENADNTDIEKNKGAEEPKGRRGRPKSFKA